MNDSKNNPKQDPGSKQDPNLNPEAYLDQLLQQFLDTPTDPPPDSSAQTDPWDKIEEEAEEIIENKPIESAEAAPEEKGVLFSEDEDALLQEILASSDDATQVLPDKNALKAAGLISSKNTEPDNTGSEGTPGKDTDEFFVDPDFLDAFGDKAELEQIFSSTPEPSAPVEETEGLVPMGAKTQEIDPPRKENVQEEPPVQKKHPKKNNPYGMFGIPHFLSTIIWLILVVCIGAGIGRLVWDCATDVLAFGREDKAVTITITANDDLDSLTDKLETTGLITKPGLFKLYAKLSHTMQKVGPGTYELNTLYDYHALVQMMSPNASNRVTVDVMIPEGYTCAQIFELLQKKGVCTVSELENASINGKLANYWFLEGVKRDSKNCLEGYLFPDTYTFYIGDSADRVLNKMLDNFDVRFTENMAAKLETLNQTLAKMMAANGLSQEYIDQHKMTIREVVIIASMIEKETSGIEENYLISSVIYNRLTNPNEYPHLNIDATLVYITGHTDLTQEDMKLDSPYNTYLHKGLIPGPISNPGRASLDAALDPEETKYYFYALDPKANSHHFSKTYEEHQAFLESLKKNEE